MKTVLENVIQFCLNFYFEICMIVYLQSTRNPILISCVLRLKVKHFNIENAVAKLRYLLWTVPVQIYELHNKLMRKLTS